MLIISHRGNLNGRKPLLENSPVYIDNALSHGFHVEIDVRCHAGTSLRLGHDTADYPVNLTWLERRSHMLLVHIKDPKVLSVWPEIWTFCHCFVHTADNFTVTSQGRTWLHDLDLYSELCKTHSERLIVPLMTKRLLRQFTPQKRNLFGVCTDHPQSLR